MKRKTHRPIDTNNFVLYALLAASLLLALRSRGANIFPIVPGIREGNSFSTVPFTGTSNSFRFQQVYDSVAFSSYGQQPYLIQRIDFRTDGPAGQGFVSRFPAFQINLSTTTRAVDGLSANFAENVGLDDTAVLPFGAYQVSANHFSDITPQVFSMFITFSTPFYYDPSQGNLLLDIRNFGGGTTSWGVPPFFGPAIVDAANVVGDSVSRAYALDVNALSGTADSLGLVTQFLITPIPEPSTLALLGIGLAMLSGITWKRMTKRKEATHVPA